MKKFFMVLLQGLCFATTVWADTYVVGAGNYATVWAALDAGKRNKDTSMTIELRGISRESRSLVIPSGFKVKLVNPREVRESVIFTNTTARTECCIKVEDGASLSIGGIDNDEPETKGPLIIRAVEANGQGQNDFCCATNSPVLVKAEGSNAVVRIGHYSVLLFGRNVLWLTKGAQAYMSAGVLASGTDAEVNVTSGTFTLDGGYILPHYNSFSQSTDEYDFGENPIMVFTNVVKEICPNGGLLGRGAVSNYLMKSSGIYDKDKMKPDVPLSTGVHVFNGASFVMNGGSICGFLTGSHLRETTLTRQIVDWKNGEYLVSTNGSCLYSTTIIGDCAKIDINGGRVYANSHMETSGGSPLTIQNTKVPKSEFRDDFYDYGHVTMTGGEFCYNENNNAKSGGGAMRLEGASTFEFKGGSFHHNVAEGGGGAIRMVAAKLVLSGEARMEYNHALSNPTEPERYCGGALAAVNQPGNGEIPTLVEMNGGIIRNNCCDTYGGGITITDKGNQGAKQLFLDLNGTVISNNTAVIGGGGVYIDGSSHVYAQDGAQINDNRAGTFGGGFFLNQVASTNECGYLTTYDCQISGNNSQYGGGVAILQGNYQSVTNVNGQTHMGENRADMAGGGIYAVGSTQIVNKVELQGGLFDGNVASDGGGLYLSNIVINATGGDIVRNTALNRGGGICLGVNAEAVFAGTLNISHNVATNLGGGVVMNNDSLLVISNGTFSWNSAQMGGGAHLLGGARLTIRGGNFFENSAFYRDGGDRRHLGGGTEPYSWDTAWHTERYDVVSGVGGGIYLGAGPDERHPTVLDCPADEREGLVGAYSNKAARAGNEIVSAGLHTYVNLPNRVLRDKEGEDGHILHWFEDYYVGGTDGQPVYDSHYDDRFNGYHPYPESQHAMRYMTARLTGSQIRVMEDVAEVTNRYLCLALGYAIDSPVRNLWISDHQDAGKMDGTNWVHLAFRPIFDVGHNVRVKDWFLKARQNDWLRYSTAYDEAGLTNVVNWRKDFRYRDDESTNDADQAWITVPLQDERPTATDRLWKIIIDEKRELGGCELEYAAATNGANVLLDTGATPDPMGRIRMRFRITNPNRINPLFCARSGIDDGSGSFAVFGLIKDATRLARWRLDYDKGQSSNSNYSQDTGSHELEASGRGLFIDGETFVAGEGPHEFTVGSHLHLFGTNVRQEHYAAIEIYWVKLEDRYGNLYLDLVPWKDREGNVGMLNKVNGQFLLPSKGTLTPGPDA